MGFLGAAYPWVKTAHLVFVVFWMAGLFMLPRFLVYHQEEGLTGPGAERWIERERKLRGIILTPSLVLVWLLGLLLATAGGWWTEGWLHTKLLLVLLMTGYHGWAVGYAKRLARGEARLPARRLRMLNEVPGILFALIAILVIVKPF